MAENETTEKETKKSRPTKPKTVNVRYDGTTRMGTINPRRMWSPGDQMEVTPEIAANLIKTRGFTIVRRRRK